MSTYRVLGIAVIVAAMMWPGCRSESEGSDVGMDAASTCPGGACREDGTDAPAADMDADESSVDDVVSTDGEGEIERDTGRCRTRSSYVATYQPNVLVILDRSESMEGAKMRRAKRGLSKVADALGGAVRVGVSAYPIESCCCSSRRLLEMGAHSASDIETSWSGLTGAGGTPTGVALYQARTAEWTSEPGDTVDDQREKAVILITDGEPNGSKICPRKFKPPLEQARKLYNGGQPPSIPVYVVGFEAEGAPKKLDVLAKAGGTESPGGTHRFYSTEDPSQLADAVTDIALGKVGCTFDVTPPAPDGASVAVSIGGRQLSKGSTNGFTYRRSDHTVVLHGTACETLQTRSEGGTTVEIDVGCPGCRVVGEACGSDAECCAGADCREGTCTEPCRALGESCSTDGECCNASCATEGAMIGQCRGG